MGLSAVINEKMMANISLNNLLGSINWGIIEAEKVEYSYFTENSSLISISEFFLIFIKLLSSLNNKAAYPAS